MSDIGSQLLRKYQRQLISPDLRWHLYVLYILQLSAVYDAQPVFSVMSDLRTQPLGKAKDKSYLRFQTQKTFLRYQ